jgi:hypothetical protein
MKSDLCIAESSCWCTLAVLMIALYIYQLINIFDRVIYSMLIEKYNAKPDANRM